MGKSTLKNPTYPILFSFFLFFSLSTSTPLHYQSFLPLSLPLQNSQTTLAHKTPTTSSITKLPSPTSKITESPSAATLSLDLHHRDSLSSSAPETLLSLRLTRDAARVDSITHSVNLAVGTNGTRAKKRDFSSSVVSGLAQGSGEYFTRLGVGTPPRYAYVVLDTGSDIIWIQCAPCKKCYSQSDPIFNPRKSSTYAAVGCSSPLCRQLDLPACDRRTKRCLYQVSYGDGSFTVGDFSTETLTFRKTRVKKVAIGCGHDNEGLFVGAAGLMGLGRGKLSFPVQTGLRFGKKFSYCLVDRTASSNPSSLIFGNSAVSRKARFTPLLTNPNPTLDTFYYLGLTGISVGGQRVKGVSSALFKLDKAGNGGVIIDSGTSVTRLTRPAYLALRNAFQAGASDLKRAPNFSLFDTCFDLSGKNDVNVPTVSLHFTGADMLLPASNYLIPVDSKGTFCFAFAGTTSGLSIIGNIQQQGFRVVYDLAGNRVGFAPNGCA